ncbi:MAG: hypothetical protein AAF500_14715 [Myxococcota bacterium]
MFRSCVLCCLLLSLGCASDRTESSLGEISVSLTAESPGGDTYQLRDATFKVYRAIGSSLAPDVPKAARVEEPVESVRTSTDRISGDTPSAAWAPEST